MTGARASRPKERVRVEGGSVNKRLVPSKTDLRDQATMAGLRWAELWFDRAGTEHRGIEGGWPGTMSEARAQVVQTLVPWLRKHGKCPTEEFGDFEAVARVLYSSAREAWRQRALSVATKRRRVEAK